MRSVGVGLGAAAITIALGTAVTLHPTVALAGAVALGILAAILVRKMY